MSIYLTTNVDGDITNNITYSNECVVNKSNISVKRSVEERFHRAFGIEAAQHPILYEYQDCYYFNSSSKMFVVRLRQTISNSAPQFSLLRNHL